MKEKERSAKNYFRKQQTLRRRLELKPKLETRGKNVPLKGKKFLPKNKYNMNENENFFFASAFSNRTKTTTTKKSVSQIEGEKWTFPRVNPGFFSSPGSQSLKFAEATNASDNEMLFCFEKKKGYRNSSTSGRPKNGVALGTCWGLFSLYTKISM